MPPDRPGVLPLSAPIDETVRLTGLSKTTLYRLLNNGDIEARKYGRTTLVLIDSVRRFVEGLPKASFGSDEG